MANLENRNDNDLYTLTFHDVVLVIAKVVQDHSKIIAMNFTGGLVLATVAAFFLNPWVVETSISNESGFLDINAVKKIQTQLPAFYSTYLKDSKDLDVFTNLKNRLSQKNWAKNIFLTEFLITKDDLRAHNLPDQIILSGNNLTIPSKFTISIEGRDINLSRGESHTLHQMILDFIYLDKTLTTLAETRSFYYDDLNKIQKEISKIRESLRLIETNIDAAKDIESRITSNRLNETSESNLKYPLIAIDPDKSYFLPINSQIVNWEIEKKKLRNNIEQQEFSRQILEHLINRSFFATKELIVDAHNSNLFKEIATSEFWSINSNAELSAIRFDGWQNNYYEDRLKEIVYKQNVLRTEYGIQKLVKSSEQIQRRYQISSFIFIGIFLGLIGTALILIINYVKNLLLSSH